MFWMFKSWFWHFSCFPLVFWSFSLIFAVNYSQICWITKFFAATVTNSDVKEIKGAMGVLGVMFYVWSYSVCTAFPNLNCVQNAKILQESSFQSEAVRIYLQWQGCIDMSARFQWMNIRRHKYDCRQKRRILLEYGCKKHPHPYHNALILVVIPDI